MQVTETRRVVTFASHPCNRPDLPRVPHCKSGCWPKFSSSWKLSRYAVTAFNGGASASRPRYHSGAKKSRFLLLLSGVLPHGHHAVHGRLQLLWITGTNREYGKWVELRLPQDIPVVRGQRRSTGLPRCRDDFGELHCIHTAAGKNFVRILHQPNAVGRIHQIVGGDHRPLTAVVCPRLLSTPN